ncbi:MAG: DUF805 domain-containing protein [Muribaculaceae bacterium]|nr:DUF805 domain-containing protein [Muribaculaceae bacterium]
MTDFGDAVRLFFQNYANFNGRASRSMYWWVMLFNFIVACAIGVIGAIIGSETMAKFLDGIYTLAVLVPSLSIGVRRMHDIGKGGGWIFISLIPFVGWIWYIVLCCSDSEPFDNRFGPVPYAPVKKY